MRRNLFLAILAFSSSLFSQTTSTSILGTVMDSSGAVISGAKVTVTQVGTGLKRQVMTSSTGDYNFPLLDVGEYEVMVEMQGFKTETRKNVTLQLNQKARIDFTLQVGAQAEVVEVKGEAPLLRTDEASLGQVVGRRRISELPLNGRNVAGLAVLQPGVQFGPRMGLDGLTGGGGGVPIPGATIALVANGQRETDQHATLDGVVATEARVNTIPFTPSIEAIEEFRVQSGSYSAEYGTNSGAQLTIALRSGTNDFHGTVFHFLRNDVFDAENYFQNYFNAPGAPRRKKDGLRQNQFGFVFSGPFRIPKIYDGRDKTFFMFDWEMRLRREPGGTQTANHPPLAFRNGDLSALLSRRDGRGNPLPPIQIVDPISGQRFDNNIIPRERISTTALALMKFWPDPQRINPDPLTGVNWVGPSNLKLDDDQRFIRVDHNFSSKDKVFGRYAFQDITYFTIPGDNPNFTYFVAGRNQNVAGQWVHIFSPALINEFRYGYNRSVDNTLNPRSNTDFDLDALGMTGFRVLTDNNRKFTSREAGLPNINTGFSGLGDRDGGNGYDFNNLHQFSDNVNLSRGPHNFKTGFDFRRISLFRAAANVARGTISFDRDIANNGFAAFLLGYPGTTESPEGLPKTDVRQNRYAGYFLDDWKAGRKLTLNLGLRYEYNSVATDVQGLWRSLSFRQTQNGIPILIPNIHTPFAFYDPEKKLFMPRIGFAYRATDRWVVRGGYGIYYNVHQLNNYTILNLNPPLSGSSQFSQTAVNGVLQAGRTPLTFAAPFGAVNPTSPVNANALNPDDFEPRFNQWSLDVQRQLPFQIAVTVGYVGNKGTHIDNTVELNNPDPGLSSLPTTAQQRRPYQFLIDGPGGPQRPVTRVRWLDSGGNSWYHGLQVNVEKRFSRGLQFNVAHTYSKSMGEGYGRNEGQPGNINNTYQNPRNRAAEKSRYGFDARQNTVISFIYEIPGVKSGPARYALGGWQMNGIWTLRSGFPFSVSQGNTLNTFNSPVRPDRLRTGTLDHPTVNQWFDTEAFRLVTCTVDYLADRCHYGSAGPGILEGPHFRNLDFSLFKNIPIQERLRLQFRAEFFNLFNSPNFSTPNSTLTSTIGFFPVRDATGKIGPDPVQGGRVNGPGAIGSLVSPMRVIQFGLKLSF